MLKKFIIHNSYFILLVFMVGCVTVPQPEYFVPPLEQQRAGAPKLKYLYDLRNEKDLYKGKSLPFLEQVRRFLFGIETPVFVLEQPFQVTADRNRVYVTDIAKAQVVVFDLAKRRIYSWGGNRFQAVSGIAVDKDGRVYLADPVRLVIDVFDPGGNFLYQFGKGGPGFGEFTGPQALAINKERELLYVLDRGVHRIHVFDLQGNYLYQIGGPGTGPGEFSWAQYFALDQQGKVYVTDSILGKYQVFSPEGKFLKSVGEPGDIPGYFGRPKGIAVDIDGNVYVADAKFEVIQIFNPEGRVNFFWKGVPPVPFSLPQGLYFDEQDRLYVVDTLNKRIQVYQYIKKSGEENK